MTNSDRDAFLTKIESLDIEIGDALADDDLPQLVALAGKAALVCATAMLYQQPAPSCVCCDRPADPDVPGDLDLCQPCYNAISAPWPGVDEYTDQVVTDLIGAGI